MSLSVRPEFYASILHQTLRIHVMCGRYTLTSTENLVNEFELVQEPLQLGPRFNIAPTQQVPVVDNRPKDQRALTLMRWGLIPRWAKDPAIGHKMINARQETAAEKPAFRDAFRRRRCLVVADGFYEWKRAGKAKTPFYVRRVSRRPMAFAGLWERWRDPEGHEVHSFTILTTGSNELVAPIHNRMPLIVTRDNYDRWLEPGPLRLEDVRDILVTPPAGELEMYEVSRVVNSPRNEAPTCIEPVARQGSLFDSPT